MSYSEALIDEATYGDNARIFELAKLSVETHLVDSRVLPSDHRTIALGIPMQHLEVFLAVNSIFGVFLMVLEHRLNHLCMLRRALAPWVKRQLTETARVAIADIAETPAPPAPTPSADTTASPPKRVLMLQLELDDGLNLPPDHVIGEALLKTLSAVLATYPSMPTPAPTRH